MSKPEIQYYRRLVRALGYITDKPGIRHYALLYKCQRMGGTAMLSILLNDLLEHEEITIETTPQRAGPGRQGKYYLPTGRTTRPEPLKTTRPVSTPDGVPIAQDRQSLLRLLEQARPDKVDWDTIRDVVNEAHA